MIMYRIKIIMALLMYMVLCQESYAQQNLGGIKDGCPNAISVGTNIVIPIISQSETLYGADLSIGIRKHVFFGGVVLSRSVLYANYRSQNLDDDKNIKIGFNAGYEYYPFDWVNRFNLFIKYEFLYSGWNAATLVDHYYKNNEQFDILIDQEIHSIHNLLGVGVNISITKWMCINVSINSGLEVISSHTTREYNDGFKSSRDQNDQLAVLLFKLGIKYKLHSTEKKQDKELKDTF